MQEIKALTSGDRLETFRKRTSRVIMTDEARVLRELRVERQISMRALGAMMNKSDSYVSQIENGRLDIPSGDALDRYLAALAGISSKSFFDRVRRFRVDRAPNDRDELLEIAKRANEIQVKQILLLAKTILATEANLLAR